MWSGRVVLCCASLLKGVKEGDGDQQGVISVFVCEENRNIHGQRTCRTTKKYNQRQRLASRVEQVGRWLIGYVCTECTF
jgi:hypothetical protein